MKIPISNRLLACAAYVRGGAAVADVGTDHGYLGIYLLRQGIAASVIASDLRTNPLEKARRNAEKYGVADRMQFFCCDGLEKIQSGSADTVVCAGMGADCIIGILTRAAWLREPGCRLILQPQSSGQALREWLTESGFAILRETLVEENGFLYTVLEAEFSGTPGRLSPGQQFLSPQLLAGGSPLLGRYREKLIRSMETSVAGIRRGNGRKERLAYYESALAELEQMEVPQ